MTILRINIVWCVRNMIRIIIVCGYHLVSLCVCDTLKDDTKKGITLQCINIHEVTHTHKWDTLNMWKNGVSCKWDKLGKFCYDEARRRKKLEENTIKVREVLLKFCWSADECAKFLRRIIRWMLRGIGRASHFRPTSSSQFSLSRFVIAILLHYKVIIPFEYLSWDHIQEGGHGH